jgi:protein-S-isoprenylcysteine O-methyltransferase Ste14
MMITRYLIRIVILACILSLPTHGVLWPEAWIFLVLIGICSVAFGTWLKNTDPDLYAERQKTPLSLHQKPTDLLIMISITVAIIAWFILIVEDVRYYHWSYMPVPIEILGAFFIINAFVGWMGVMRANTFGITSIRLQPERGHVVISHGPYAVVRHPMYSYIILFMIGSSLLLGSWWGVAGLIVLFILLALRIRGEEALLKEGLPGYQEYTEKVRYRLIPWVW